MAPQGPNKRMLMQEEKRRLTTAQCFSREVINCPQNTGKSKWCDTGFVARLFFLLAEYGYRIYLTSDHGNVEVDGIGRLSQGVVSELRGERVRTYRSDALAASVPAGIDAFRFDIAGLPADFLPLYAHARGAFVSQGDQIVAHGGISVEELIVPFIRVSVENENQ